MSQNNTSAWSAWLHKCLVGWPLYLLYASICHLFLYLGTVEKPHEHQCTPQLVASQNRTRGNYGKIEVARNLFPTHKIISLELVEDVCEIFLKKSHHIPAFWRAEVEIFFRTGIVGGSSPGQLIGNGILYDFRVSSTPCTTYESSEPLHMLPTIHTCVFSPYRHIYRLVIAQ